MVKLLFIEASPALRSGKDYAAQQASIKSHAAIVGHHRKAKRPASFVTKPKSLWSKTDPSPASSPSVPGDGGDASSASSVQGDNDASPIFSVGGGDSDISSVSSFQDDSDDESPATSPSRSHRSMVRADRRTLSIRGDTPYFRGTRTDPFNCIPTDHPDLVNASVDYFTQVTIPAHASLYELFNITCIYNNYWFDLMQNPDFAYTGVCLTLRVREMSRDPNAKVSDSVLKALGIALSRLRTRLASAEKAIDDVSITAVSFMAATAKAIGDPASHQKHKDALKYMVQARGGLEALGHDGMDKCMLLQREGFWSLKEGPTLFRDHLHSHVSIYPTVPLSGAALQMATQLPPGFQALAHTGTLSLQVLEVLARTQDAYDRQTKPPTARSPEIFQTRRRRYSDFREACPCLQEPDHGDGTPRLERLLVLAVIVYCCSVFTPTRSSSVVYEACRNKLQADIWMARPENTEELECQIWIAAVLVDSWTTDHGELRLEGITCLMNLKAFVLQDLPWEDLETILFKFFWSDKMSACFRMSYNCLDSG